MIKIQAKKTLINSIPSIITVDGASYQLQKSFGKAALNTVNSPAVNLSIINEGKRYSRSIDDCTVVTDATVTSSDIRSAILRYTVGASAQKLNASDTIRKTNSSLYSLRKTPVVDIINVGTYIKNVNYKLQEDHETFEWLISGPAIDTNFTVDYSYMEDGYWIASGIADYLMQDILANLIHTLAPYDINVISVGDIVDLSTIYSNDALSVCVFDVQLSYPYTWMRTTTDEDGVALESIDVDLYANEKFIETIHVP